MFPKKACSGGYALTAQQKGVFVELRSEHSPILSGGEALITLPALQVIHSLTWRVSPVAQVEKLCIAGGVSTQQAAI